MAPTSLQIALCVCGHVRTNRNRFIADKIWVVKSPFLTKPWRFSIGSRLYLNEDRSNNGESRACWKLMWFAELWRLFCDAYLSPGLLFHPGINWLFLFCWRLFLRMFRSATMDAFAIRNSFVCWSADRLRDGDIRQIAVSFPSSRSRKGKNVLAHVEQGWETCDPRLVFYPPSFSDCASGRMRVSDFSSDHFSETFSNSGFRTLCVFQLRSNFVAEYTDTKGYFKTIPRNRKPAPFSIQLSENLTVVLTTIWAAKVVHFWKGTMIKRGRTRSPFSRYSGHSTRRSYFANSAACWRTWANPISLCFVYWLDLERFVRTFLAKLFPRFIHRTSLRCGFSACGIFPNWNFKSCDFDAHVWQPYGWDQERNYFAKDFTSSVDVLVWDSSRITSWKICGFRRRSFACLLQC